MLGATVIALSSCSTVDYYWQGIRGQAELVMGSEPIDRVIADEAVDPRLRKRLQLVLAVREFASAELGLPDNGSYRSYVDLRRPFVVWNVVAAPEFSLKAKRWCFPVAGCVSYRGFFNEHDARAEAERLKAEGYEVHLGGVPAYSTLGYFDDPVLNTFVNYPEHEVARLIFHELAHQALYVPGNTAFNESFASTVEEVGIERWMAANGKTTMLAEFTRAQAMRGEFRSLVSRYRDQLKKVYASPLDKESKRREKAAVIAALRAEYESLKNSRWDGYSGYDAWFANNLNNAKLAAFALYADEVPAFRSLLKTVGGDLRRFYVEARRLASERDRDRDREGGTLAGD